MCGASDEHLMTPSGFCCLSETKPEVPVLKEERDPLAARCCDPCVPGSRLAEGALVPDNTQAGILYLD
jgi:hypothetical protein